MGEVGGMIMDVSVSPVYNGVVVLVVMHVLREVADAVPKQALDSTSEGILAYTDIKSFMVQMKT